MNVLILGSGGREHALSWKIRQSQVLNHLYIGPGNAGTAEIGTNVDLSVNDFNAIRKVVIDKEITLVLVGPEDPLVNGLTDYFRKDQRLKDVMVIGPGKEGAQLEGSKDFAKKFMQKYGVPTARYATFSPETLEEGLSFLSELKAPYVLKADGLAAGKGVVIAKDLDSARSELKAMLEGKFGKASKHVVIEEYLDGIELSVFVLTDGKEYVILPEAKDYKRIGEGDTGLNTGGMGAISPVPFADKDFMEKVEKKIIKPTIHGICEEGFDYCGFVFFGLMKVGEDPYVIEYNVRMGDPETEVVIPRIEGDFLQTLMECARGNLHGQTITIDHRSAATVMLVSAGYPEEYEKGKKITGHDEGGISLVFHAGTKQQGDDVVTNGGRVLSVTSYGTDFHKALNTSYTLADRIQFEGKYFRKDIGFDL